MVPGPVGKHLDANAIHKSNHKADRKTLAALLELCSGPMGFVRDRNFAGWSFDPRKLEGLERFILRKGAEYEFVDLDLERLRKAFNESSRKTLGLLATNTFPVGDTERQSVPEDWEIEQPERLQKAVSEVHQACDVLSYDQLVRTARRKLLA